MPAVKGLRAVEMWESSDHTLGGGKRSVCHSRFIQENKACRVGRKNTIQGTGHPRGRAAGKLKGGQ